MRGFIWLGIETDGILFSTRKIRGSKKCAEFLDKLRNYQLLNSLLAQFNCVLLAADIMMQDFS